MTSGQGTLSYKATKSPPDPWPICAQLPCVCLGNLDENVGALDKLTQTQATQVLRFPCNSTSNSDMYKAVTGKNYLIPKRVNCGTYKPERPTYDNRCECPDMGIRKSVVAVVVVVKVTTLCGLTQWVTTVSNANQLSSRCNGLCGLTPVIITSFAAFLIRSTTMD